MKSGFGFKRKHRHFQTQFTFMRVPRGYGGRRWVSLGWFFSVCKGSANASVLVEVTQQTRWSILEKETWCPLHHGAANHT